MPDETSIREELSGAKFVSGYEVGRAEIIGGRLDGFDLLIIDLVVEDEPDLRLVVRRSDARKLGRSIVEIAGADDVGSSP